MRELVKNTTEHWQRRARMSEYKKKADVTFVHSAPSSVLRYAIQNKDLENIHEILTKYTHTIRWSRNDCQLIKEIAAIQDKDCFERILDQLYTQSENELIVRTYLEACTHQNYQLLEALWKKEYTELYTSSHIKELIRLLNNAEKYDFLHNVLNDVEKLEAFDVKNAEILYKYRYSKRNIHACVVSEFE